MTKQFERISACGRRVSPALLASTAAILTAVLSTAGCRPRVPPPLPPPAVTVARPLQHEVIEWDDYTGHLDAVESVDVRARVGGLVVSTPFREGAIVAEGDLLVEIDVRPYQADLDSKVAAEGVAAAQLKLAEIQYDRLRKLMPEKSASYIEFKTAEATFERERAALAAAQANVAAARLNVEWCKVIAPIAGRISRKNVTPGNIITGGTGTGTLLTTITSIDPIYCYVDADERSVLKYQKLAREGKRVSARDAQIPCFLQLTNEAGFPHQGVIDFVDNRLDATTGTILARGVFPNPKGWLTPGFFARLRVPGSGSYSALLVPDAAIATEQSQKLVFVVAPDNVVAARPVVPGALFGELRVIESGIGPNDPVIISGLMQARPGIKVNPTDAVIPATSFPPIPPSAIASQPAHATSEPTTSEGTTQGAQ